MTTTPGELPTDLETCHQLIRELLESLSRQSYLNEKLQHQLEQLLRRIYGRKSEKLDPNQLLLFAREIMEATGVDPAADSPAAAEAAGRSPTDPPRRTVMVVHCPRAWRARSTTRRTGATRIHFGSSGQPDSPKYACKACQANVVIAERLPEPIEKGLPGPGLLAQVIVSKYADHLPLYRQEGIFRRHGVELSRQTMCDWMTVSAGLLEPIVKAMHREILKLR